MKTYKLNGLDIYTVAFNRTDATVIFLINRIGVVPENIIETDITPKEEAIGKVFRSLEEYNNFKKNY